jgi:hypothetical protein
MKIKMRMLITGTRNSVSWPPIGGIVDLPEDEAQCMIRHGYAIAAPEQEIPLVERAAVENDTQTAIIKTRVAKRGKASK